MKAKCDYITISIVRRKYRGINMSCEWFDNWDYYLINDDGNCLTFEKYYSLETNTKVIKKTSANNTQILSELPIGKFYYDKQETTEDKMFIYYLEQL